jgi:hypothetical protein
MDEETLERIAIYLAEGFLRGDANMTISEMAEDLDISEEEAREACVRLLPLHQQEED